MQVWHDVNLKLLAWGALFPLCFVPELAAEAAAARWPARWAHPLYRHLAALGGAANIVLLVGLNLVGFAIDAEGGAAAAAALLTTGGGLRVLALSAATFFVGVQLDLEIEAARSERRERARLAAGVGSAPPPASKYV